MRPMDLNADHATNLGDRVHGSQLLDGAWNKINGLRRLNLFAHGEEISKGTWQAPPGSYSITLARPSNDSGTVTPRAMAVFRLTTSSTFVDC
jgi:hypothetical protein